MCVSANAHNHTHARRTLPFAASGLSTDAAVCSGSRCNSGVRFKLALWMVFEVFCVCVRACVPVHKCMICASYVKALCIIRQQRKVVWDDGDERGRERQLLNGYSGKERGCVYVCDTHIHMHTRGSVNMCIFT